MKTKGANAFDPLCFTEKEEERGGQMRFLN
jgi:hypothetical protein